MTYDESYLIDPVTGGAAVDHPSEVSVVEFVRARLDEREASALTAFAGPWRYNPRKQWHGLTGDPLRPSTPGEEYVAAGPLDAPVCVAATGPADDPQSMADAAHIAHHDPNPGVLAEVAALQRVVDTLTPVAAEEASFDGGHPGEAFAAGWTLEALANMWADHADFDPAWAPEEART
jgi:hypothetical protein